MTLISYDADKLDQLALRLFDLAAEVRRMSTASSEHQLDQYKMHDKKALEWLTQLEAWAHRSAGDLDVEIIRQKARHRADEAIPAKPGRRGEKTS